MKTYFKILTLLLLLVPVNNFANNTSLFKRYVPHSKCRYSCARGIRKSLLKKFFDSATYIAPQKLSQKSYAFIIDFKMHSSKKRGHLLNLKTGKVSSYIVAHGIKSDPNQDGYATDFSNISGSNKSSLGLYTAAETYHGSFGYSMKLDGREPSNDRARSRAIVMHATSMSNKEYIKKYGQAGFSRGCPAVSTRVSKKLIDLLKNGSLYYIGN